MYEMKWGQRGRGPCRETEDAEGEEVVGGSEVCM